MIVKAEKRHLDNIIDLYNILGTKSKYKFLRKIPFIKTIINQFDRIAYAKMLSHIYVLEKEDGIIKGLVNLDIDNESIFIRNLVVSPTDKEYGQELLNYVKFKAINNRIPMIELFCSKTNVKDLKFYRRNRFKETKHEFPDGTILMRFMFKM